MQDRPPDPRGLSSESWSLAGLRRTAEGVRHKLGCCRCRDPVRPRLSGSWVCLRSRLHRASHERPVLRWGSSDPRFEREERYTSRSATWHLTQQSRQGTPSVRTSFPTLHPKALAPRTAIVRHRVLACRSGLAGLSKIGRKVAFLGWESLIGRFPLPRGATRPGCGACALRGGSGGRSQFPRPPGLSVAFPCEAAQRLARRGAG